MRYTDKAMDKIKAFYNRRNRRLARRDCGIKHNYDRASDDYDWITINGAHVPINKNGTIVGGAEGEFKGEKYTGSKAEKNSEKGSFKLNKSAVKSKTLKKAVSNYEKEHDGQLPGQMEMHDLAYTNLGVARMKARRIQNEYARKYGFFTINHAEQAEWLERKIEEAGPLRDSFDRSDPEWQRWEDNIQKARETLQEHLDDPDYEKHKKDWNKLKGVVEIIDSAKDDAKAFLVNKGKDFKSAEEAGAWIEVSGWVEDPGDDKQNPKEYGTYSNVSIRNMARSFACATAGAIDVFQKKFPKLQAVVTEVALRGMSDGDMGGFDPALCAVEYASGYFSIDMIGRGTRTYEKNVRDGHFPAGTTIDSVPYHEFTHAMEEQFKIYDGNKGKGILGNKRPADVVLERVSKRLNLQPAEAKAKVSIYALREYPERQEYDNAEFLAEALSEAYTSPTPRAVAKAAQEEFEKLYHEIYD